MVHPSVLRLVRQTDMALSNQEWDARGLRVNDDYPFHKLIATFEWRRRLDVPRCRSVDPLTPSTRESKGWGSIRGGGQRVHTQRVTVVEMNLGHTKRSINVVAELGRHPQP